MRKMIMGCFGITAALMLANVALAELNADCAEKTYSPASCNTAYTGPCDAAYGCGTAGCGTKESLWIYGGWAEAGFYANQYGQKSAYYPGGGGFVPLSGNTGLLNNVEHTGGQLNSLWLFAEKKLARNGVNLGGRVDFVFGTDAQYTQASGFEYNSGHGRPWGKGDYYTSFAQAYAELGNQKFSVKVGKFLAPFGGESIQAPNRFFYSLDLAFTSLPVTSTGILATWNPNRKTSVFGGWVNGQRIAMGRGRGYYQDLCFDDSDNGAFLGGFNYKVSNRTSLGYTVMLGKEKDAILTVDRDYFIQTLNVTYTRNRWENIAKWTLRNDNYDKVHTGAYGLSDELIYRVNCKWAVGFRAEWMRAFGGHTAESDAYEFTAGINWTPYNWLLIRPELRYDKVDGAAPFDIMGQGLANGSDHQFSGGMSAVVKF